MQEGANINKSLTTLGKVISALAEVVSVSSPFFFPLQLDPLSKGTTFIDKHAVMSAMFSLSPVMPALHRITVPPR